MKKLMKTMLALLALGFALNSYAINDDEYIEYSEALTSGNLKVVKKFVKQDPQAVNALFFGWKPLQMAANHAHLNVVEYLMEHGADKDYVHPISRNTAFHMAVFTGDRKLIKYLADHGVDINIKLKGDVSLITYFRNQEQPEMVSFLEQIGVKDDGCKTGECF